jgi:hypothetical protein
MSMSPDYAVIIETRFPGAEFVLNGEEYSGLEWRSAEPMPTKAELDALWPEVQQEVLAAAATALANRESARLSARSKLLSQGFTDAEIDVMYPTLVAPSAT